MYYWRPRTNAETGITSILRPHLFNTRRSRRCEVDDDVPLYWTLSPMLVMTWWMIVQCQCAWAPKTKNEPFASSQHYNTSTAHKHHNVSHKRVWANRKSRPRSSGFPAKGNGLLLGVLGTRLCCSQPVNLGRWSVINSPSTDLLTIDRYLRWFGWLVGGFPFATALPPSLA